MLGLVAILAERVFLSTRSADPVFDLRTLPLSLRVGWARALLRNRLGKESEDVLVVLPARNIEIPIAPAHERSGRISKVSFVTK